MAVRIAGLGTCTLFDAELSADVETFDELTKRPWALRDFQHTPRPYVTLEEF